MNREELDKIWKLYAEFCITAHQTQTRNSESAPDFLGWLERKLEENVQHD